MVRNVISNDKMNMNKTRRIVASFLFIVISATWVSAQDGGHWQCNIYNYQYDMTVYFSLIRNETSVSDLDGYEVAAFVGDECRGVASFQSLNDSKRYGYLRVRSNQAEGETITFKVYQKDTHEEFLYSQTLSFESQGRVGLPSSPYQIVFHEEILGDANGDGTVNVTDVVAIVNYILGSKPNSNFITNLADVNGDGKINVTDAVAVVNILLARSNASSRAGSREVVIDNDRMMLEEMRDCLGLK